MIRNIIKASLLDRKTFLYFKTHPESVVQSLAIVALSGVTTGAAIRYRSISIDPDNLTQQMQILTVSFSTVLLGWVLWAFISGTLCKFWGGQGTFRETTRCIGISYSPAIIFLFATFPYIDKFAFLVAMIWILISGTYALASVQGISLVKSAFPSFVGWAMSWLLLPILMLLSYISGPTTN